MKSNKNRILKLATAVFAVAIVISVIYIMLNGLGLVPELDFGAGAYYYADIPEFEKYVDRQAYESSLPVWLAIILFLLWGFLMWKLWKWVDSRN